MKNFFFVSFWMKQCMHYVVHATVDVYDKQLFLILYSRNSLSTINYNGDYKADACTAAPRTMKQFFLNV